MNKNIKIYIAGNTGLVGNAIEQKYREKGYNNLIFSPHSKYDLRNQNQVQKFFSQHKPEHVIIAAAKVGGIIANNKYRAEFIYDNLLIQSNIIHQAYKHQVKKLLFLGSSCIYPKFAPQPIKEKHLLTSPLEYTNEPYAIAKIAGLKTIESYNLQYGTNFFAVMPTNLFGENDNFHLENSHVLPAIIRKIYLASCLEQNNIEAIKNDLKQHPIEKINENSSNEKIIEILEKYGIKKTNKTTVKLWGTGKPKREFLYAADLADACIFLMENINFKDILKNEYKIIDPKYPITEKEIKNTHINIGTGKDQTINELAQMIKKIVGFNGQIIWNTQKPDGTPQKLLDVSKINSLGWKAKTTLQEGITAVFNNYKKQNDNNY